MKKLIAFVVIIAPLFFTEISSAQVPNMMNPEWMNPNVPKNYDLLNPDKFPLIIGSPTVVNSENCDPGILLTPKNWNCDPGILLPPMNWDVDPGMVWDLDGVNPHYKDDKFYFEKPNSVHDYGEPMKLYPNSFTWPDLFSLPLPQNMDLMKLPKVFPLGNRIGGTPDILDQFRPLVH